MRVLPLRRELPLRVLPLCTFLRSGLPVPDDVLWVVRDPRLTARLPFCLLPLGRALPCCELLLRRLKAYNESFTQLQKRLRGTPVANMTVPESSDAVARGNGAAACEPVDAPAAGVSQADADDADESDSSDTGSSTGSTDDYFRAYDSDKGGFAEEENPSLDIDDY
ncbi:uncharacterized protein BXZ73DRAFT_79642 [Epithele typhae]|uniref:uncharacterized protein n=1 Tax=Epithele typhae TaxID=378194 RepID=UPI002007C9AA|nr:uncharacterized protein BXZ73DRAFT_79642 [Epithele typhae]KAH9922813.1 hypothetical protein BXZ73DRAFT_79642 [Epithele typhae]